jgi:hypothetical protein
VGGKGVKEGNLCRDRWERENLKNSEGMRRGCGARQGREREREQQQQQQLQQLLQCSVIGVARHDIFSRLQKRVSYWGQLVSSSSLGMRLLCLALSLSLSLRLKQDNIPTTATVFVSCKTR